MNYRDTPMYVKNGLTIIDPLLSACARLDFADSETLAYVIETLESNSLRHLQEDTKPIFEAFKTVAIGYLKEEEKKNDLPQDRS